MTKLWNWFDVETGFEQIHSVSVYRVPSFMDSTLSSYLMINICGGALWSLPCTSHKNQKKKIISVNFHWWCPWLFIFTPLHQWICTGSSFSDFFFQCMCFYGEHWDKFLLNFKSCKILTFSEWSFAKNLDFMKFRSLSCIKF